MRKLLKGVYPRIRWSDIKRPPDLTADEEFVQADLADKEAVEQLTVGVDGIVHLGGYSTEGSWDDILSANIVGCNNIFEAAHVNKVKRVVFASSVHAVGFYLRSETIGVDVPPRPDSRYGISKVFGEAVAKHYAERYGLRVTVIRIGNVNDVPIDERRLSIWLKPEDLVQLIQIGLEHPAIQFEVFYGASDNAATWWDNSNAYKFGYKPVGKAEDYRAQAMAAQATLP
ncbi:MAG: NAD-dependent epimerase/dehydratase family protein, partial [Candidatus Binatia bacterium]